MERGGGALKVDMRDIEEFEKKRVKARVDRQTLNGRGKKARLLEPREEIWQMRMAPRTRRIDYLQKLGRLNGEKDVKT